MTKPIITIHVIANGFPLCEFTGAVYSHWPLGHISCQREEYEINAAACNDPEHDLHSVMRYEMCSVCEDVHKKPKPEPGLHHIAERDLPVIPSNGQRKCRRCQVPIVAAWPYVHCTLLCAGGTSV